MWNIDKIKAFTQRQWPIFLLIPLSVLFFLGTSYFNYASQTKNFTKWSSPDETANYTFAKLYAEEGRLEIPERYNLLVKDVMHPRSFRVFEGVLKPMSFLGIILLYGKIAHYFGAGVIPFLTPVFGSLGLWFFYFLLKEIFNRRVALIGAVILAIFPVYFYFTSKSMFHNILFLVMLLGSSLFIVKAARRQAKILAWKSLETDWLKILYFCLGGLFLGWTIATRTSELLWLGPSLIILYILNWRRIAPWQVILIIASALIALMPVFYHNIILYGEPLKSGYAEVNTSINNLTSSSNSLVKEAVTLKSENLVSLGKNIFKTIFYFGFHPKVALGLFWKYTNAISPWLVYGSLLGFGIWLADFKRIRSRHIKLLIVFLIFSAILITYYGSWDFHDNPDKNAITIGNSYTRYWLPIYLCLIAWLAVGLDRLSRLQPVRKISWLIIAVFIAVFAFSSWPLVYGAGSESLATNIAKSKISYAQQQQVLKLTERNAVIITKYQDKLFFPERKVVYGLFDDNGMIKQYAILAELMPTYFYSFTFSQNDLQYLNKRRLPPLGLKLQAITTLDEFTLYRLIPL